MKRITYFLRPLDEMAGRVVFGNTNSFSRNRAGRLDIRRSRVGVQLSARQYSRINVNQFVSKGFTPVQFGADLMNPIVEQYQAMIENPEVYEVADKHRVPGGDFRRTIYEANLRIPAVRFLLNEELKEAICHYYQSYFDVMRVVAYRNYSVDGSKAQNGIYSNLWHCDTRRPSVTKLMVNLSDVSDDHGPFHIQSVNETRRWVRSGFRRGDQAYENESRSTPSELYRLVGGPGSALLCNTQLCLHKAGVPAPGLQRDLLMIQMLPSKTPLDENWIARMGYTVR